MAQGRRAGGPFSPFSSRVAPQRLNFYVHASTMRQILGFAASCDHGKNASFGKPEWQQVETAARLDKLQL